MNRLSVLTAVGEAAWEAGLLMEFERTDYGITVVRRCVDMADLLASAQAGRARAVLLSADLRNLDREALTRLDGAGLAVVGVVAPGDDAAERRLRQLGLRAVVAADAPGAEIAQALQRRLSDLESATDPGAVELKGEAVPRSDADRGADGGALGRVVAVWGPTGAPGRTSVAVNVASELALTGRRVLLVDADSYGGSVAQVLGLLEEAPGLAGAARAANAGTLDVPAFARLCRDVGPGTGGLNVLTGIVRPERWPELRPSSVAVVLDLARRLADVIVVDCGFCLEHDEELSYDTLAPRRNGSAIAALEAADEVLAVGSADPVGLQRLIRSLGALRDLLGGGAEVRVVLNRVRRGVVAGDPAGVVVDALERHAGVVPAALVPFDVDAFDAAMAEGRTLAEAVPGSSARAALRGLALTIAVPVPAPRRGRSNGARRWGGDRHRKGARRRLRRSADHSAG